MSFSGPAFNTNIDLSFDQTLGLDLAPGYDYGFSSDNAFNVFGLDMMRDVEMVPRQKKKKVAWVEVNKLIDGELQTCLLGSCLDVGLTSATELIKHGVCLGRAPGFRRKDVDMAIQNALVSTE
jgi:hypothetical protein